jgi:Zn-dependent M28 family amino/carboxypeptidase
MGIDTIPFAHRGIDSTTFSSGSLGRATYAVHSAGDVAENLDPSTLARSARWVREVARRLTAELAEASRGR